MNNSSLLLAGLLKRLPAEFHDDLNILFRLAYQEGYQDGQQDLTDQLDEDDDDDLY